MKTGRGTLCLCVTALAFSLATRQATAQSEPDPTLDAGSELSAPVLWPLAPELDRSPGWSIGLDGYAGLAVLSTADGGVAHGVVGGISRFQLGYFQLGATIEASDGGEGSWRSIGGFVGAFIPYRHWVDFEFAAGLAARTYRDESERYGADGYEATSPALTLRAGFSDRALDSLFGLRLGGHIAAGIDLKHHTKPWSYVIETDEETRIVSGASEVGGFSVGIALTAGFDIGRKRAEPVRRSAQR